MGKDKKIEPKYYTVNQLAEYSSLSASTIRRYIRYEGLPHFRMNRRILIRIDEFDS
jgi:excisionase family DNA binding protein